MDVEHLLTEGNLLWNEGNLVEAGSFISGDGGNKGDGFMDSGPLARRDEREEVSPGGMPSSGLDLVTSISWSRFLTSEYLPMYKSSSFFSTFIPSPAFVRLP